MSFLRAAPVFRQATRCSVRNYSAATPKKDNSNTLLLGAAGTAAALAAGYLYLNKGSSAGPIPASTPHADRAIEGKFPAQVALDKEAFKNFKLKKVTPYNHDSSIFEFELPGNSVSGLQTASLVVVKSADDAVKGDNGKPVIRPYTPIKDERGKLVFLVKKYDDGKFTPYFHNLKPGDELAIKGPIQKIQYKPNQWEEIGLIGGGSGITPLYQIIETALGNPEDKTKLTLLFANKSEADILLREEFDQFAKDHPDRFKVVYALDKAPDTWTGITGYLDADTLKKHLPNPSKGEKVKNFVCGPPGQMKAVSGTKTKKGEQGELAGALKELGYSSEQVFKF